MGVFFLLKMLVWQPSKSLKRLVGGNNQVEEVLLTTVRAQSKVLSVCRLNSIMYQVCAAVDTPYVSQRGLLSVFPDQITARKTVQAVTNAYPFRILTHFRAYSNLTGTPY